MTTTDRLTKEMCKPHQYLQNTYIFEGDLRVTGSLDIDFRLKVGESLEVGGRLEVGESLKIGEWKGGMIAISRPCKWSVLVGVSDIKIGCQQKTAAEWDAWFAGNNEYETPRDSPSFALIRANYEVARSYQLHVMPLIAKPAQQ